MVPLEMCHRLIKDLDAHESQQHSVKDYHVKGLDYINLFRTSGLTGKLYIIRGHKDKEIVYPHDHGYEFETTVVLGSVNNVTFTEDRYYKGHVAYDWDGIQRKWKRDGNTGLTKQETRNYEIGASYFTRLDAIHTIQPTRNMVVLFITQYRTKKDKTTTYIPTGASLPDLSGLYTPMSADYILEQRKLLLDLIE